MNIGIFSRTWESNTLEEVFKAMTDLGIYDTQFNLTSAGLPTMPDTMDSEKLDYIKKVAKQYNINLCALSGTFNMIDPNIEKREEGIRQFEVLCKIARYLEIPIITLCTGSRNLESKWKWHDDNNSVEAWRDLLKTTSRILKFAEENGIILGVETEASNIINTPERARLYLDSFQSSYLKIVMDGANLFLPNQIDDMKQVLETAFTLLGDDIVLAHAKDLAKGEDISFVAAGEGVLDFDVYIHLLNKVNYKGPLVMHGLSVEQTPRSIHFLKEKMNDA